MLQSSYSGTDKPDIQYRWYQTRKDGNDLSPELLLEGKTSPAMLVLADGDNAYRCEVVAPTITIENNLMENGDFETVPEGVRDGAKSPPPPHFSSVCKFAGWAVTQDINNWQNRYAMVHNAHDYNPTWWTTLKPHSGEWYAVFDPETQGYVWRAETKDNPRLKVEKGKEYVFSYYAANAAKPELNAAPARLRFMIDNLATPEDDEEMLGKRELISKSEWEYHEVTWKAPYTSDNIAISVYDEVPNAEANDFCLDDIFFQPKPDEDEEIVCVETFLVQPQVCCEEVVREQRDTAVCASVLPIVWEGITFEQAGENSKTIPTSDGLCDSVEITYALSLLAGVEMYAKWDDVIYVPNPDSLYVSYQWYRDDAPIDGATDQFLHDPNGLHGLYHCVMQTVSGSEEKTCPAQFEDLERSADHNPGDAPRQLVSERTYYVDAHLYIVVFTYDDQSVVAEKHWIR